ncbi:hypothetical protein [Terrimonas pollutisoli]|uniref:hypothetical protein n=1 Tax=Terrimonas pollutisoli TaxID=3034147 RepID=UPI0023ED6548|nr:hypothetical protein [Terrimonas sp. H1YJ31]
MALVKKVLNKLNGLHYQQEYLCFSKEALAQPLHVYLTAEGQIIKDITDQHLFTGYNPLIITLAGESHSQLPVNITIIFAQKVFLPNDFFEQKAALATLSLRLMHTLLTDNFILYFFEGIKGHHHFIHPFYQYVIGLNNRLYNRKKGNVFLHNNLYKQVQIAYSVPRIISLITVGNGELYNLFPTDLHGPVNNEYYIGSLRYNGKACRQVEQSRKILLTEVNSEFYKAAYLLGKNHMQELRRKESFPFSAKVSPTFQLPVPLSALRYRELELIDSFTHGIHRLFIFKIISFQQVENSPSTLAHIHNVYATWRYNQHLPGNYLLR